MNNFHIWLKVTLVTVFTCIYVQYFPSDVHVIGIRIDKVLVGDGTDCGPIILICTQGDWTCFSVFRNNLLHVPHLLYLLHLSKTTGERLCPGEKQEKQQAFKHCFFSLGEVNWRRIQLDSPFIQIQELIGAISMSV